MPLMEVCRKNQISPATLWKSKFGCGALDESGLKLFKGFGAKL